MFFVILIIVIFVIIIYREIYFKSKKFQTIRQKVSELIKEFNDMNVYADSLSANILGGQTRQIFVGEIQNISDWNYKHNKLFNRENNNQIFHCSRQVVSNAQFDGFKYVCKYFNIPIDEIHRNLANDMLNNFNSYLESRDLLLLKQDNLFNSIKDELPFLIKIFKNSLYKNLGMIALDLKTVIYPRYNFQYTSSGGNSGLSYTLELSTDELQKFINWLDERIKYKKSAQYQRIIMTNELRNKIKQRDGFSCKICKVNTVKEPTLLLEIDHIVPISKGGLTVEDNLQCLCWKCNRKKAAKI